MTTSFPSFSLRHYWSIRVILLLLISAAGALTLSVGKQSAQPVFAQPSRKAAASLNLTVRDSMTGNAAPGDISSRNKDRLQKLATNADGSASYRLSTGRSDLEIHAVGYKDLTTYFEADSQSVKSVTVWVDPIESPPELRPEVITSKMRSGQALLHGHVYDSATKQPISGARVYLECAGVESQTNDRGYFLLYAPVASINQTEEPPTSDTLVVSWNGFEIYRRTNTTIAEGATHFIIDTHPGEGLIEIDGTHKLMLGAEQLEKTQTEKPEIETKQQSADGLSRRDGVVQPLSLAVPASIRVGSSCSSKTSCTVFNVYSLDTYVKNGLDDEWFSSWNAESLKAGAIAYRSYGVYYVYHPLSVNYDICNTTSCQVNDPTDSATSTRNAVDNTTGIIVTDSTGNNPFFAEYAAENNDSACADGFTGSPSANWSCLSDPVDAGQTFNGHGRGMCQWGTQRWAVNQGKDYVWIANHYYNDNGNPNGARSGVLQIQATPTPTPTPTPAATPTPTPTPTATPTPAPLLLLLDESGPAPNQAAALDSILLTRDPFAVVNGTDLLNVGSDRNTRVIIFVMNLQLSQGETASSVVVNLIDSNNQAYDVTAEDVRPVTTFPFTQVIFRLPNNLPAGTCGITVRAHGQVSNAGTMRIRA